MGGAANTVPTNTDVVYQMMQQMMGQQASKEEEEVLRQELEVGLGQDPERHRRRQQPDSTGYN